MKFEIKETNIDFDGTKSFYINLAKKDLVLFGYILESFEGWGNYTTVSNKDIIVLKVVVSPSYIIQYEELFRFLKQYKI